MSGWTIFMQLITLLLAAVAMGCVAVKYWGFSIWWGIIAGIAFLVIYYLLFLLKEKRESDRAEKKYKEYLDQR